MRDIAGYALSARISVINLVKEQWQIRGWLAALLWPLSVLTQIYVWVNSYLFKNSIRSTYHLEIPIIVVGNVVVGGAGKTPVVIELVNYLCATGRKVGVISKGYGRTKVTHTGEHPVQSAQIAGAGVIEVFEDSSPTLVGDEPKLIQYKTSVPVFVSDKRANAASALLAKYPDTDIIISDDGLQHNALGRDINIVVFDNSGVGNGFLLPAGPLREPWPRVYKNAAKELVLSTNQGNAPSGFTVTRSLSDFAVNGFGKTLDLRTPISAHVHALAGIARPEIFFEMLIEKGVNLSETTLLEDHADFSNTQDDFLRVSADSSTGGGTTPSLNSGVTDRSMDTDSDTDTDTDRVFLCTEKDAVKIWEINPHVWAVPLECHIDPKFTDELEDALVALRHR